MIIRLRALAAPGRSLARAAFVSLVILATLTSCALPARKAGQKTTAPPLKIAGVENEPLLSQIRQLTFAGRRSGEGYFSTDGERMVFQSEREPGNPFYQIYLMDRSLGIVERVSPGVGKTTCSWIHPGREKVLFASTHEDAKAKQKQKEELALRATGKARRYSWDYDETYEIYEKNLKNGKLRRLTKAKGYDAEGAWSPDGKQIVFASNREAYERKLNPEEKSRFEKDKSYFSDIYIMDENGGNVRRLTDTPGYDGGPFFSADGEKIIWRRFSEDGSTAEVFTMSSDGTAERQVTDMKALSWAPFFHPAGDYFIFASAVHGMENFELYIARADGSGEPVRVTKAPSFDGLPVFLSSGSELSWTSKRNGTEGPQIYFAKWDDNGARKALGLPPKERSADSGTATQADTQTDIAALMTNLRRLASPEMEGRLTGSEGERKATEYAAARLQEYGLLPAGDNGSYFQQFSFTAGVSLGPDNKLQLIRNVLSTELVPDKDYRPVAFSATGEVPALPVAFAGFGIKMPAGTESAGKKFLEYDSYAHLDVKDKWVLVFRNTPQEVEDDLRKHLAPQAPLRYKAMIARHMGAKGILFVSGPGSQVREELVPLAFDQAQTGASIAAISVTDRTAELLLERSGRSLAELFNQLNRGEAVMGFDIPEVKAAARVDVVQEKRSGRNVLAVLPATVKKGKRATVALGAHIDHLGRGKDGSSLAKGDQVGEIHYGADDNASGVAAAIEVGRLLAGKRAEGELTSKRDLLIALWSGEEMGLLGSSRFTNGYRKGGIENNKSLRPEFTAYLNMDMVGRLDKNVIIQGIGSSPDWARLVEQANAPLDLSLVLQDESYLPTDGTSFYLKKVPILSAFTGAHPDYHTPGDTEDKINYPGLSKIASFMGRVTEELLEQPKEPPFFQLDKPGNFGKSVNLRAYLGSIPDYSSADVRGVRLAGVSSKGPAEEAGLQSQDVIISVGGKVIENIYDYTYAIDGLKIGEKVEIIILRGAEQRTLTVIPRSRE